MGFLSRVAVPEVRVISSPAGRIKLGLQSFDKGRAWFLEDRTVILCVPSRTAPGEVDRLRALVLNANAPLGGTVLTAEVVRSPEALVAALAASGAPDALTAALSDSDGPDGAEEPQDLGEALSAAPDTAVELLVIEIASCNCGMGAVGAAAPLTEAHDIQRVRAPAWFQEA
jgi:hypothetical protein